MHRKIKTDKNHAQILLKTDDCRETGASQDLDVEDLLHARLKLERGRDPPGLNVHDPDAAFQLARLLGNGHSAKHRRFTNSRQTNKCARSAKRQSPSVAGKLFDHLSCS